ncbi:MAG: hypothetical protein PHD55_00035 [Methanoregula sp.]|nr:hypothetical protein [Methanoregula sp.]
MKVFFGIILLISCTVILAGCTMTGHNATAESFPPSDVNATLSPSSTDGTILASTPAHEVFTLPPILLPLQYQDRSTRGAFDDSYLGSYECSNGTESYSTNYTLFAGNDSTHHVRYTLVPVDPSDESRTVPLSSDILEAGIYPDDFIARPGYAYRSQLNVTLGPNVTGESHTNPDGSGWSRDPYFPFRLEVTIDGSDAPDANDRIAVTKICSFHSQTRSMQPMPGIDSALRSPVVLNVGETQNFPVRARNYGGGLRELYFTIPSRIPGESWSFPLESSPGQLQPIPDGLAFSFDPVVMSGTNFHLSNTTLTIGTDPRIPPGNYSFPLVLCYRNLDLDNQSSLHFPFSDMPYCGTATSFTVDIV